MLILGGQLWDVARWFLKEDINRNQLIPAKLLDGYMSDLTTALRSIAVSPIAYVTIAANISHGGNEVYSQRLYTTSSQTQDCGKTRKLPLFQSYVCTSLSVCVYPLV